MLTKLNPRNLIVALLLAVAVGFNLITLHPETTIKSNVNDNVFQLGLLNTMNEQFSPTNSWVSLLDHWVPNWADGYPLPFYYSHIPHLFVIVIYKVLTIINHQLTILNVFDIFQFLLLSLMPLSFFFGAKMMGFTGLTSALIALFSSHLFTDGLYGIDPVSFVWRGYGLSLEAISVFFLPLAVGSIFRAVRDNRGYLLATIFLALTLSSHLATGYIGLLSCFFIPLALINNKSQQFSIFNFKFLMNLKLINFLMFKTFISNFKLQISNLLGYSLRLLFILLPTFLLLSYWFIPLLLNNQYHNISFWDAPSKWFSYGFETVINMFFNGQIFDWGRLPILTGMVVVGFFVSAYKSLLEPRLRLFFLLFVFWFLLFFGERTWGSLIYLLPMTREYHLHRFIIGVHFSGIFIIGIGVSWLMEKIQALKQPKVINFILCALTLILITVPVYKTTYDYLALNTTWINQANITYDKDLPAYQLLVNQLKQLPPGRIYAGRPGNWGKDFKVGPTPMYMALSSNGFELAAYLPETWSLNSDPEQLINEDWVEHFNLYNIRYLVTPKDYKIPTFAKTIKTMDNYKISTIDTTGYFDIGYSDFTVQTGKENLANIVHSWLDSDFSRKKQFPAISLVPNSSPLATNLITMIDETNFLYQGKEFNLFNDPLFKKDAKLRIDPKGKIISEEINDKGYSVKVDVDKDCQGCLVVFKMTYHPGWNATIDGQPAKPTMVFPNFMAIPVDTGMHQITYYYKPDQIKAPLLLLGVISLPLLTVLRKKLISTN